MNKVFFNAEDIAMPLNKNELEVFALSVLEWLGQKNQEVSVLFCSNRYIKSLNARYRNMDEPTDVLSFPLEEKIPGGRCLAGDIVISLDALEENARLFGVDAGEELRRLLVHGMLHLSGQDHATNRAEEPMLKMQEEILASLSEKV
ncbi:MAG: rRNA maturation RNase YbeY [Treponema sp.]|nr:rRNA maturation RNase YbeY [Treponema sp.]